MSGIYFRRLIWLGNVELIQRVLLTGKEIIYRIILITHKKACIHAKAQSNV